MACMDKRNVNPHASAATQCLAHEISRPASQLRRSENTQQAAHGCKPPISAHIIGLDSLAVPAWLNLAQV